MLFFVMLGLFIALLFYVNKYPNPQVDAEPFGIGIPSANDFASSVTSGAYGMIPPNSDMGYDSDIGLTW